MAALSCGLKCLKYTLFAINLLLFLAAICFLALGIWIKVDAANFVEALGEVKLDTGNINLVTVLDATAYIMIVFGAFVFLVGFLGCCGAIKESRCMLATYAAIVIICLIVEVVAIVLGIVFLSKTEPTIKNYISQIIQERYNGTDGTRSAANAVSFFIDHFQYTEGCCGLYNSSAYATAAAWNRTMNNGDTMVVPITCCVMAPDSSLAKIKVQHASSCPTAPTSLNSYKDHGCYNRFVESTADYPGVAIGVGVGLVFIQIFVIVAACRIYCRLGEGEA